MKTVDPVSGLRRGSYVCLDRGHVDFAMFAFWTKKGINFVTRAKRNMSCGVRLEIYFDGLLVQSPLWI
jgi:hypothetical protein